MEHGKMSMNEALKMNVSYIHDYQGSEAISVREAQIDYNQQSQRSLLQRLDQLARLIAR